MASLSHSSNISTGTNCPAAISSTVDYKDFFHSALTPMCLDGLHKSTQAVSVEGNFALMQPVKSGITQAMKSAHAPTLLFMSL